MATIKEFTRESAKEISDVLANKIKKISAELKKEYGITVKLQSGGKYTDKELTVKISASINGYNSDIDNFTKYCSLYGLSKNDLNREFLDKSIKYKIIGIKPSRRKYPIICKNLLTGKLVLFTSTYISKALKK